MIMEAVFARSSPSDHQHSSPISTYNKKIKNYDPTNKNARPSISRTTSFIPNIPQLAPTNNNFYSSHGSGLLMATHNSPIPPKSNSIPVFNPIQNNQPQKQPPLLPLPLNFRPYMSLPRSHSVSVKQNRTRSDQSSTPRKAKKPSKGEDASKEGVIKKAKSIDTNDYMKIKEESLVNRVQIEPTLPPIGPDPNDLPKDVCKMLLLSSPKDLDKVFGLSPPPSSLPLPKFSVRPKLGCNAEAAATDSVRRLFRLR